MPRVPPGTCKAELQGFPIQVSGLNSLPQDSLTQLSTPLDIQLQFSPSQSPIRVDQTTGFLNYHGENTFFLGGTQYNLRAMRICQAKQEGLAKFSGTPIAELQYWGTPTATSTANIAFAVLSIPIRTAPSSTFAGNALYSLLGGDAVQISDLFPTGRIVRYVTCLETTAAQTSSLAVAYWAEGISITSEMAKRIPTLKANGIPKLLSPTPFLTVFEQVADGSKINRRYEERDGVYLTYTKGLTATGSDFQKGFRIITTSNLSNQAKDDSSYQQNLSNYKCITLDKSRDIKNGKLVLNPLTGRPFVNELEEQEAEKTAEFEPASIGANTIWIRVCIVIGVLIGIGLLAAGLVLAGKVFMKPEGAGALAAGAAVVPGPP